MKNKEMENLPEIVPIIVADNQIIFPKKMIPFEVKTKDCATIVEDVLKKEENERFIGTFVKEAGIGRIGTLCLFIEKHEHKAVTRLLLQGLKRVVIKEIVSKEPYLTVRIEEVEETGVDEKEAQALFPEIITLFRKISNSSVSIPREIVGIVNSIKNDDVLMLADIVADAINITVEQKDKILRISRIPDRMKKLVSFLHEQIETIELGHKISTEAKKSAQEANKKYMLRKERDYINKQLGDDKKDDSTEVEEYERRIKEKNLPEDALKEAEGELKRLKRMNSASHEYSVVLTYLDWLLDLPWNDSTEDDLDIAKARKQLDDDHYGLEKPKKRMLEYLAVRQLNPESRSPILCMHGPPGCIAKDTPVKIRRGKRNSGRTYTIEEAHRKFNHIFSLKKNVGKGYGDRFWSKDLPTKTLSLKGDVIAKT